MSCLLYTSHFFDSSIKFELSFVNMATDSTEFEKRIRITFQKDGFDDVRAEYSQMLRQQLAKGNNGLDVYKRQGIDYAIRKDTSEVPPRYLVFFKAPDAEAFHSAFKE